MQLETLYKRTKTGAIQYWKVTVEDPIRRKEDGDWANIRKESGQLGTDSPVKHCETIREGKQKRNYIQQAWFQAESDWKKKHDEGYKTLDDLKIVAKGTGGYWDPNGNHLQTLQLALDVTLPQFNTDAAGELLPQLAKSKLWFVGDKNNIYPALYEHKYDGNRTTIVMDLDRTYALSRTGKPQSNLGHLIAILDEKIPFVDRTEKVILDGEVYLHGLVLEEINEAIKKANVNTPLLQFMMYDLPLLNQQQDIRSRAVVIMSNLINSPFFPYSVPVWVNSDEEVLVELDKSLELGYEGGMVKMKSALYQPGQRSSDWKKVKIWDDTEFKVVAYELGQRGVQDLKFICESPGGTFEATMNGSLASKQAIYDNIEFYIGKMLTVQHKGYTKYNIPNLSKGKLFRDE